MSSRVSFLGLGVDAMTTGEATHLVRGYWQSGEKARVFFVNAHCVNTAATNQEYRDSLAMAEHVLADGSGVLMGSKLLDVPITHNLNGTDLVPLLCAAAAEEGRSVFLLGAHPGIACLAARKLRERHPTLRIVGVQHGYFPPEETDAVVARINAAKPDLLLVAFGVPSQEIWVTRRFAELDAGVMCAVGALFDFMSETVPRAPRFFRKIGIEWLYRLCREPKRLWRRYLIGNVAFLSRVFAVKYLGRAPIRPSAMVRGMFPVTPERAPSVVTREKRELVEVGAAG